MVKTGAEDAPKHKRHSMIVVDAATPGIEKLRPMEIYGHDDAPHGHYHLRFTNVRVPAENMLLGEERGLRSPKGRLGPGRIHHCMRAIGQAEAALELMCKRSLSRTAFGKPLAQLGANFDIIADARMEIEMARLLCLKAAWMMDQGDPRAAAPWISKIKVVAPIMALKVVDEAIQLHGAGGISQDTPLRPIGCICGPCVWRMALMRCIGGRWPVRSCASIRRKRSNRALPYGCVNRRVVWRNCDGKQGLGL